MSTVQSGVSLFSADLRENIITPKPTYLPAIDLHGMISSKFKRRRLRISRIDGQTRKIENPDNLPEEHLWGTIFENVIDIF